MAEHDGLGRALPAMPQPYAIPSTGSRQRHATGTLLACAVPVTASINIFPRALRSALLVFSEPPQHDWCPQCRHCVPWCGVNAKFPHSFQLASAHLTVPHIIVRRRERPRVADRSRARRQPLAAQPRDAGDAGDPAGVRDAGLWHPVLRRHVAGRASLFLSAGYSSMLYCAAET